MDLLIVIYISLAITLVNTIAMFFVLVKRKKLKVAGTKTLILLVCSMIIFLFREFATSNWHYHLFLEYHRFIYPAVQIGFIVGPLLYFYVNQSLGLNPYQFRFRFLHFIPYLLVLSFTIYQVIINKHFVMWQARFNYLFMLLMSVSVLIYSAITILQLKQNGFYFPFISKQTNSKSNDFVNGLILFMIVYWCFKIAVVFILIDFDITDIIYEVWIYFIIHVGIAVAISIFLYHLIRDADLLVTKSKKTTNFIENKDHTEFLKKLSYKLEVEKVYTDPEINLSVLSEGLNINPRYLSTIINSYYNIGFTELINKYRLDESKSLLINRKEMTIQEIMYQVGFNSKSVFNTCFKKQTGLTPKEFRMKFEVTEN